MAFALGTDAIQQWSPSTAGIEVPVPSVIFAPQSSVSIPIATSVSLNFYTKAQVSAWSTRTGTAAENYAAFYVVPTTDTPKYYVSSGWTIDTWRTVVFIPTTETVLYTVDTSGRATVWNNVSEVGSQLPASNMWSPTPGTKIPSFLIVPKSYSLISESNTFACRTRGLITDPKPYTWVDVQLNSVAVYRHGSDNDYYAWVGDSYPEQRPSWFSTYGTFIPATQYIDNRWLKGSRPADPLALYFATVQELLADGRPTTPDPVYTFGITSNHATITAGDTVIVTFTASTNVSAGEKVPYTITGVTKEDLTFYDGDIISSTPLAGTVTIQSNHTGSVSIPTPSSITTLKTMVVTVPGYNGSVSIKINPGVGGSVTPAFTATIDNKTNTITSAAAAAISSALSGAVPTPTAPTVTAPAANAATLQTASNTNPIAYNYSAHYASIASSLAIIANNSSTVAISTKTMAEKLTAMTEMLGHIESYQQSMSNSEASMEQHQSRMKTLAEGKGIHVIGPYDWVGLISIYKLLVEEAHVLDATNKASDANIVEAAKVLNEYLAKINSLPTNF